MPGVVITPALWTSIPLAPSPSVTRSAIHELDSRVSCPMTAQGGAYVPGETLTQGFQASVSYFDPDVLVTYSGALWELEDLRP